MENKHVSKHDFKFNSKSGKVNKLSLRNMDDFNTYIQELIPVIFNAQYENGKLIFADGDTFKIDIQENKPTKN